MNYSGRRDQHVYRFRKERLCCRVYYFVLLGSSWHSQVLYGAFGDCPVVSTGKMRGELCRIRLQPVTSALLANIRFYSVSKRGARELGRGAGEPHWLDQYFVRCDVVSYDVVCCAVACCNVVL